MPEYAAAMAYRDEEEALRARNEALVSEVEALERRAEEREIAHRSELLAARGIVGAPSRPAPERRSYLVQGVLAGLIVVGFASAAMFFTYTRESHHSAAAYLRSPTWHARVKSAAGMPLAVGSECVLEAKLGFRSADSPLQGATMKATCGSTVVYDSAEPTEGESDTTLTETHRTVDHGRTSYDLSFDEQGPLDRQKPRASIATSRGVAVFTREQPELRVELSVSPGSW